MQSFGAVSQSSVCMLSWRDFNQNRLFVLAILIATVDSAVTLYALLFSSVTNSLPIAAPVNWHSAINTMAAGSVYCYMNNVFGTTT